MHWWLSLNYLTNVIINRSLSRFIFLTELFLLCF